MTSSLSMDAQSAKTINAAMVKAMKHIAEQRQHLLYLVRDYIRSYSEHAANVLTEMLCLHDRITVCNNVSLELIVTEYEEYYFARRGKYPKLCMEVDGEDNRIEENAQKRKLKKDNLSSVAQEARAANGKSDNSKKALGKQSALADRLDETLTVTSIAKVDSNNVAPERDESPAENLEKQRSLKSIQFLYPNNPEFQAMAKIISREIVIEQLNVQWEDIIDYEDCKSTLRNAILYPLQYPALFRGKFASWQGILLYGPPGTGKTMLAKAIATACKCTFFNITASSLVSKWRGDSEKYLRVLFDLAKYWAPTIIFIDEVDWVSSGDASSTSEPARRFRAEFLARFDGLLSTNNTNVILLATTNLPWNIDAAVLRRFEKKIFVNLPDDETRQHILEYYVDRTQENLKEIIESLVPSTKYYSCADLKLICKEARMQEIITYLNNWPTVSFEQQAIDKAVKNMSCYDAIQSASSISDFLHVVRPIPRTLLEKYVRWNANPELAQWDSFA